MKKFILFINLFACALSAYTQDINFSQFYELPLLRNPALAGIFKGDIRINAGFRSQWGSVTVPYQTQALGAELRMPVSESDYLSVGIQLTNDVAGDSKMGRTQFLPMITFNKCLSSEKNTYLSFGVLGGVVQQRFDPSALKFDDQFVNGSYSSSNPTQQTFGVTHLMYGDLNAGLVFSSEFGNVEYYIGGAYFHFINPRLSFDPRNDVRLNRKTVVNAGINVAVDGKNKVIVYGDIFMQGGNHQAQGGLLYKHDLNDEGENGEERMSFSAGSFYRLNDAVIPVVKLDYYKFGFGFSYDVNISKLKPASQMRGAYELTLSYRDFLGRYNTLLNKTRCPVKF